MFRRLKDFQCKDIEDKYGIPCEITDEFFDGRMVPYAFVKIYQEYFGTPSLYELLDVGIENGDVFCVSLGENTSYFQAIEFNGYVMPA